SKTEQSKDAGSKAWWAKPRPEDAGMRRFAGALDLSELFTGQHRGLLDATQVVGEVVREQRLRAVADRPLRLRVDLDDDPVRAGRRGGVRQRGDERALARRVAR